MGNNRFRFLDMIPNAWFYKLKGMSESRRRNHAITSENPTKGNGKHQQSIASSSSSSSTTTSSFISSSSSNKTGQQPQFFQQRKSYYFTRDLSTPPSPTSSNAHVTQPPDKEPSSEKKRIANARRNRPASTSDHKPLQSQLVSTTCVFTGCSCRPSATIESVRTKPPPDSTPAVYPETSSSSSDDNHNNDNESIVPEISSCLTLSPETLDGMLSRSSSVSCSCKVDDMENNPVPLATPMRSSSKLNDDKQRKNQLDRFGTVSEFNLPPIKTNIHRKFRTANAVAGATFVSSSWEEEEQRTSPPPSPRRLSVTNLQSLRIRNISPRIGNKRIVSQAAPMRRRGRGRGRGRTRKRRSLSESFAVVKSSRDPKRDFRESMVEMIVENNIRASRDLEDLLACYLSLNSNEYHELIIGVFKQIWFDLVDVN